jgi:hypothetical protein
VRTILIILFLCGVATANPVYPPHGAVIHHPSGSRVYQPRRRYTRQEQLLYLLYQQARKQKAPVVEKTTVIHNYYNRPTVKKQASPKRRAPKPQLIINPYVEQQ